MTSIADSRTTRSAEPRVSRLRIRICVATVLACLPYTLLKIAWVLGWGIGVTDAGFTDISLGANSVTGFMDLVAIVLAVALVHPAGRRIPTFLVAGPLWIGIGLLVPVAGGFAFGSIAQLATGGGSPAEADGGLQPWVFLVVYGGFVLQAVLLGAGFTLYARERWPWLFAGGREPGDAGPTRPLQNLLGGLFVPAALGFGALCVGWAVTGGGRFLDPSTAQRVMLVGTGALGVAGAVAFVALMLGHRMRPRWLVLGFVGTGVVFTDALSGLLNILLFGPGDWGYAPFTAGESVALLFIAFCAIAGAIGGALRLVEEQEAMRRAPRPARSPGRPAW